jgi:hypothetical protein
LKPWGTEGKINLSARLPLLLLLRVQTFREQRVNIHSGERCGFQPSLPSPARWTAIAQV